MIRNLIYRITMERDARAWIHKKQARLHQCCVISIQIIGNAANFDNLTRDKQYKSIEAFGTCNIQLGRVQVNHLKSVTNMIHYLYSSKSKLNDMILNEKTAEKKEHINTEKPAALFFYKHITRIRLGYGGMISRQL